MTRLPFHSLFTGDGSSADALLPGKRILVAGAESAGGGDLVARLSQAGARLVVQHRLTDGREAQNLQSTLDTVRQTAGGLRVFGCDLADEDGSAGERLLAVAVHAMAGLDACVVLGEASRASAGIDPMDQAIDDFTGPCRLARSAAQAMGTTGNGGQVLVIDAAPSDPRAVSRSIARRSVLEAVISGLSGEFGGYGVSIYGLAADSRRAAEQRGITAVTLLARDDTLLAGMVITPDDGTAAAEQRRRIAAMATRRPGRHAKQ